MKWNTYTFTVVCVLCLSRPVVHTHRHRTTEISESLGIFTLRLSVEISVYAGFSDWHEKIRIISYCLDVLSTVGIVQRGAFACSSFGGCRYCNCNWRRRQRSMSVGTWQREKITVSWATCALPWLLNTTTPYEINKKFQPLFTGYDVVAHINCTSIFGEIKTSVRQSTMH